MDQKSDILTLQDIMLLVDTFYGNVRKDELLAPIFETVIQDRWPQHLEKMYRFWYTVLCHQQSYSGSPFLPHAKLPIEQRHFDNWLKLWHQTIDGLFVGEVANEAKWRGDKMAIMFVSKIEYYKHNPSTPLL